MAVERQKENCLSSKKEIELLKKAVTVLVSICLALAASECLLRLSGITDSYSERSGVAPYMSEYDTQGRGWFHLYTPSTKSIRKGTESTYILQTNSQGFNDREWNIQKSDATKIRVLFMGDSFTDNVGGNGYSFEKELENHIDSIEVMNAGVSGSDPFYEYILLEKKLLKYKPDIVFVDINLSDITDVIVRGGFERFTGDGKVRYKPGPWWEPVFAKLHIVRAVAKAFLSRQFLLPAQDKKARAEAMLKIETCLDKFQAICNAHNIRCVFVFIPVEKEVMRGAMEANAVLNYCKSRNYPTIDLLHYFLNNGVSVHNASQYYGVLDGHQNAKGYAMVSKGLQQYFADTLQLRTRN